VDALDVLRDAGAILGGLLLQLALRGRQFFACESLLRHGGSLLNHALLAHVVLHHVHDPVFGLVGETHGGHAIARGHLLEQIRIGHQILVSREAVAIAAVGAVASSELTAIRDITHAGNFIHVCEGCIAAVAVVLGRLVARPGLLGS
jgi:hypothetical protein